jgi:hypothetical protein
MLRFLRLLPMRSIFFILRKTSILHFLGCKPPYSIKEFQKRKAIHKSIYVLCPGVAVAFLVFLMLLLNANMGATKKLVVFAFSAMAFFVFSVNTIFGDYFFLGNVIVKVTGHKSFELHDSFLSTNSRVLYSHIESTVNELFRNGADSVIMKSHVLGGLTSLQIHRLGGLLRRRCIGVGCGLLGEQMNLSAIDLLIGWILGVPHRSKCTRELVLLRSIDGINSKQKYIRLF